MKNKIVSIIIMFTLFASAFYNLCYAETNTTINKEKVIDTGMLKSSTEIMKVPNQIETIASGDGWTDVGNASWEITKDGPSVEFTINGINQIEGHTYYVALTKDASKPTVSQLSDDDMALLTPSSDSAQKLYCADSKFGPLYIKNVSYICLIEKNFEGEKEVISFGNELKRVEEPKYFDAFRLTMVNYEDTQIVLNFANGFVTRKEQIKIGKITDTSILQQLKNSDSTGWGRLMEYAKSDSSAMVNNTVTTNESGTYSVTQDLLGANNVNNEEYYYLYVKTDDENGKYVSNEAVTLAISDVFNGQYYMFFYGSDDFTWSDFDAGGTGGGGTSQSKDDTTSPLILPKTGVTAIAVATLLVLISTGAVSYYKVKKYKGLK